MKSETQYNLFGEICLVIEPHRHKWKKDFTVLHNQDLCKCGEKNHITFKTTKW